MKKKHADTFYLELLKLPYSIKPIYPNVFANIL